MSLPSSYSIFSPSFSISLFKSLSPQEYLEHSQKLLEEVAKWKNTGTLAASISTVSASFFTAISVAAEDKEKLEEEQGKTYNFAIAGATLSLAVAFGAFIAYPTLHFVIEPLLANRVEWLQLALNS